MTKQRGELIALSAANVTGNKLTLQVLRAGEFVDMHGNAFTLDGAALDEYAANSNALLEQEQVPCELGHPDDPGAPASAWYKRFFKGVVDGVEWLLAEVELTTVGADAIAQKLYKYFSATLYADAKVITGGGFVNRPAVGGQKVLGTIELSACLRPKEHATMKVSLISLSQRFRRAVSRAIQLEMSQEEASRKLWEALREKYGDPLDEYGSNTPWVVETFDTYVIVEKGGDKFQIEYSFDGDTVVLGTPVPVEITYQPVPASESGATDLAKSTPKGGDSKMTKEQEIQAARDEERQKAELAAQQHQEEIRLAREDERKRVMVEQARKEDVRKLSADLTVGKYAFPQTAAELEEVLLKLSDEDRALIAPVLLKVKASGLVNLGEEGHSMDAAAKKELAAPYRTLLAAWIEKKQTLAKFFEINPELGKAEEYDLSAFEPKA